MVQRYVALPPQGLERSLTSLEASEHNIKSVTPVASCFRMFLFVLGVYTTVMNSCQGWLGASTAHIFIPPNLGFTYHNFEIIGS